MASNKIEIEVKASVAGAQTVDALGQSLGQTAESARKLGTQAGSAAPGLGAADTAAKGFTATSTSLKTGLDSVSVQLARAKDQFLAFAGIQGFASSVQSVSALADAWANMKSRLQLALGAQADVNKAMGDVEGVAKATYTSLDATANLYGKIATAGREMGVTQAQALGLTQTINQAIQLSGASAQASEAAVTQLIQGLQGGVVRGDEFNSIMEQSPRLAQAMADGLKVPLSALRGLAEEGKLTSQTVIRALQSQSDAIGKEFGSLPITIGRAVTNLQTEWQKFVGTLDSSTGASSAAANGIEAISKHLDDLARVALTAGAALTASFAIQAAAALRTAALDMAVTGGAAALLRTNLDQLSRPVQITIAVTGFEVGYQIGEMLRENSSLARQFGVGLVGFFAQVVNDLRLVKEVAAAVFTGDTIEAALKRYVERNKEIGAHLKEMFREAEIAPSKIGAAVDGAADRTKELGVAGQAAGAAVASGGTAGAAGVGQVGKAAVDARGALEGLARAINTKAPTDNGITDIVRDLAAAKTRGEDVALMLQKNLPEAIGKLSGPELSKFRAEFIRAMDEAGLKGKELRAGLGLIAEQAAKNLGVDVPLAFNKLSKEFVDAQGNLSVLIRQLPELKKQGVDTGAVVAQAMANMIDGAKSKAEIDVVVARIKVLSDTLGEKVADGLLDQAKTKTNELADALDKAKPGINSLREAMAELGLKSREDLQKTAEKATQAYDTIKSAGQQEGESYVAWQRRKAEAFDAMNSKATGAAKDIANAFKDLGIQTQAELEATSQRMRQSFDLAESSGEASAQSLTQAFKKVLEAQIAAGGGFVSEMDAAKAAALGLEIAIDSTGKTIVKAFGDGGQAVDKYKKSLDDAKVSADKLAEADAKRAETERNRLNIDKEGFTKDKNGGRLVMGSDIATLTGVRNFLKSAGLTEDQAKKTALEFSDGRGNIPFLDNPGQKKYGADTLSVALLKAAEQITFAKTSAAPFGSVQKPINAAPASAPSDAPAPAPAPAPAAQQPGSTPAAPPNTNNIYMVKLDFGTGQTRDISVASANDAKTLISALQQAKAAAGF